MSLNKITKTNKVLSAFNIGNKEGYIGNMLVVKFMQMFMVDIMRNYIPSWHFRIRQKTGNSLKR